jgi:hypothetical protein
MHEHPTPKPCKHELKFCEHCDTVYCEKCKTEWKKEASFKGQLEALGKAKPWVPYVQPSVWPKETWPRERDDYILTWTCSGEHVK